MRLVQVESHDPPSTRTVYLRLLCATLLTLRVTTRTMSTPATPPVAELPSYPGDSKDLDEKMVAPSSAAETKVAPVKQSHDVYEEDDSLDPVYHAKARVLGDAFQEIGMGKYQVRSVCS